MRKFLRSNLGWLFWLTMLILTVFFPLISSVAGSDPASSIERALYSDTYHYANGTSKTIIFNDFANFYNGSEFLQINKTIIASNDPLYDYMVTEGVYEVYFKSDPSTAGAIKFWYNSSRKNERPHKTGFLTLQARALNYRNDLDQIQQINMPRAIEGFPLFNSFIYEQIYGEGIELSFKYEPDTLKQYLRILSNETLPLPQQYILNGGNATLDLDFELVLSDTLEIYLENQLWDREKERRINFKDIELRSNNETVFSLKKPYASDSNKSAIFGDFSIKKAGKTLVLSMKTPYEFFIRGHIVYPIVIDPSIAVRRPSAGYDEGFPNQNPVSESDIHYYDVDGNKSSNAWSLTGSSPFLDAIDDPTNLIYTKTHLATSYDFTIENSTYPAGSSLFLVRFRIYCKGDGNDEFRLKVFNGLTWSDRGLFIPTVPYGYIIEDVDDFLDSRSKIDNAEIEFTYDKTGASNYLFIDYATLMVSWSRIPPHYTLVDDITPDNDTTCIYTSESSAVIYNELYEIPDFTLPEGNNITQIEIFNHVRALDGVAAFEPLLWQYLRTYDINYLGVAQRPGNTNYANFSNTWINNPNTTNEWTETEINLLRIGLRGGSSYVPGWASPYGFPFYNTLYCTQVFVEITYSLIAIATPISVLFIGLVTFCFLSIFAIVLLDRRRS